MTNTNTNNQVRIETRVGTCGWGDNRFRGRSVASDLLGTTTLSQLLALAIGVTLDANEAGLLDDLSVAITLADPHIWPLKLTRVVGAHGGSPILGVVAAALATDGLVLGPGAVRPVAAWLRRLSVAGPDCSVIDEVRSALDARQRLFGFGVPARKVDERVAMMARCVEARGRAELSHWSIWLQIVDETRSRGIEPNASSAFAAAVLDLGFEPDDVAVAAHMCVTPCFLANAVEGIQQQPAILREVPTQWLDYRGPERRPSGRSQS